MTKAKKQNSIPAIKNLQIPRESLSLPSEDSPEAKAKKEAEKESQEDKPENPKNHSKIRMYAPLYDTSEYLRDSVVKSLNGVRMFKAARLYTDKTSYDMSIKQLQEIATTYGITFYSFFVLILLI